jgi:hypothetical protein
MGAAAIAMRPRTHMYVQTYDIYLYIMYMQVQITATLQNYLLS